LTRCADFAPLVGAGIFSGCLHLGQLTVLPANSSFAAKLCPHLQATLIGIDEVLETGQEKRSQVPKITYFAHRRRPSQPDSRPEQAERSSGSGGTVATNWNSAKGGMVATNWNSESTMLGGAAGTALRLFRPTDYCQNDRTASRIGRRLPRWSTSRAASALALAAKLFANLQLP
jgi:hypothetical protein